MIRSASQRRANRQAGFNLIEAAIVLGIVGLIVGGIWAAASSAYENMRQQTASKQLLSLVGNIRNFYSNSGTDVVDNNVTNLYNLGLLPADMVSVAGGVATLRHQWGGPVTITTAGMPAGYAAFGVAYASMPSAPCKNFLIRNVNAARGSGLLTVKTTAGEVLNLVANSSATMPTTVACADGSTVTLAFGVR